MERVKKQLETGGCPQLNAYMVRGHEIKEVPVAGVEGHDMVDSFACCQLQCPLTGHSQVWPEGQL